MDFSLILTMYFTLPKIRSSFSRRVEILLIVFCLSVLICINAYGSQNGGSMITVHYPMQNTAKEYGLLGTSISVQDGSADEIKVDVNGLEELTIVPERKFICFTVKLEPGENTIEISAYKLGKKIGSVTKNVFRRSDLSAKLRKIPSSFKRDYFHMKDNAECAECHALTHSEYDMKPVSRANFSSENYDIETIVSTTSTCYSCHKPIASLPFVHGPASVWSCLSCHDPDTSPKYSVLKPDNEICYKCHEEQKNKWLARKYIHGPVTIGKCTICHSPHSSEYPFNLMMSTWDLCTNCHYEKGTGKHIFADRMFTDGHPTKGKDDPYRIGKELSCASCHNAHASEKPHLWSFDVNTLFELCRVCHTEYGS